MKCGEGKSKVLCYKIPISTCNIKHVCELIYRMVNHVYKTMCLNQTHHSESVSVADTRGEGFVGLGRTQRRYDRVKRSNN